MNHRKARAQIQAKHRRQRHPRSKADLDRDIIGANVGLPRPEINPGSGAPFPEIQPTDMPIDIVLARLAALRA